MDTKMYYIMDTYGNYYALNEINKLVATTDENKATRFNFIKANNIIQNMVRPMQRYQYILKEVSDNTANNEIATVCAADCINSRFDDMNMDWIGYLADLSDFCSQLNQYKTNLNYMLSEVDKEICDIMHYIEFFILDAAKGYKMYKMLKDCRLRRRKIKDEHEIVTSVIQVIGNRELVENINKCIKQISKLEDRQYTPRVLEELFASA